MTKNQLQFLARGGPVKTYSVNSPSGTKVYQRGFVSVTRGHQYALDLAKKGQTVVLCCSDGWCLWVAP